MHLANSLCDTCHAADNASKAWKVKMRKKRKQKSDIEQFLALSDFEKERIYRELDAESPEESLARSKPLNREDRRRWAKFKARGKRQNHSEMATTIFLRVEKHLLERADAYAKRHGISRANLVAKGLRAVLGSAA